MRLELQADKGENIGRVIRVSLHIAVTLEVDVHFTFNGMPFYVTSTDTFDSACTRWDKWWKEHCAAAKAVRGGEGA